MLPTFIVLDLRSALGELRHLHLTDERGYEEMLRQIFDYLLDSRQDNNPFVEERVPFLTTELIPGLHRQLSVLDRETIQNAFRSLYVQVLQALRQFGLDQLIADTGSFDYGLYQLRVDSHVILRRLSSTESPPHHG